MILTIAKNSGIALQKFHKLHNKIIPKIQKKKNKQKRHPHKHNKRKNGSPSYITVHSYTRLFKNTNLHIGFQTNTTLYEG